MHAHRFTGGPLRGLAPSQPRGGPTTSSSSPALTINIPSPAAEKGPPSRRTHTPTKEGSTDDGGGSGAERPAAFSSSRTSNQALGAEQQRYKSLFTNAPAELPGVTVVPAGGGGGDADADGSSPAGTASAQHRPTSTWATAADSEGARGTNHTVNQPTNRRRAQTARVDYHNSVRRRSSNTSFTHPVGHPSGLDSLVESQSRPDSLEGWEDGQPGTAMRAAGAPGSSRARAKAGARVSVVASAATTTGEQEEPFRWIPGAQTNRTPVVHSHRSNKKGTISPAKPSLAANGTSGSGKSASLPGEAAGSTHRLAQPKRAAATTNASRPLVGNTVGWVGAVLDQPRGSSSSPSSPPSGTASFFELPRQLAVPGNLLVAEDGATGVGGGIGSAGGAVPAGRNRRVQHAKRGGGGGGSGGRQQHGVAGGGRGSGGAESNNLHPAWRPKGLTRRQRAVSMVERG